MRKFIDYDTEMFLLIMALIIFVTITLASVLSGYRDDKMLCESYGYDYYGYVHGELYCDDEGVLIPYE